MWDGEIRHYKHQRIAMKMLTQDGDNEHLYTRGFSGITLDKYGQGHQPLMCRPLGQGGLKHYCSRGTCTLGRLEGTNEHLYKRGSMRNCCGHVVGTLDIV